MKRFAHPHPRLVRGATNTTTLNPVSARARETLAHVTGTKSSVPGTGLDLPPHFHLLAPCRGFGFGGDCSVVCTGFATRLALLSASLAFCNLAIFAFCNSIIASNSVVATASASGTAFAHFSFSLHWCPDCLICLLIVRIKSEIKLLRILIFFWYNATESSSGVGSVVRFLHANCQQLANWKEEPDSGFALSHAPQLQSAPPLQDREYWQLPQIHALVST